MSVSRPLAIQTRRGWRDYRRPRGADCCWRARTRRLQGSRQAEGGGGVLLPAWISVPSSLLEKATMSQKSSLPQPTQSVSWVLTAETPSRWNRCSAVWSEHSGRRAGGNRLGSPGPETSAASSGCGVVFGRAYCSGGRGYTPDQQEWSWSAANSGFQRSNRATARLLEQPCAHWLT